MGENSAIEWTDHTFNPWVGCTKVSPACDHCYAESWAKRTGQSHLWTGERRRTTASNWQQPHIWNRRAAAAGRRERVFCASLADVFDNQVPERWRWDLWHCIAQTPNLDWLLLTKRPQNIAKMLPTEEIGAPAWGDGWPNVWLGTTAENQAEADRRIPHLLVVPAAAHFLSCEPLLGAVDLTAVWAQMPSGGRSLWNTLDHGRGVDRGPRSGIDWVIAGGESGPGARPMHPDWARSLRDQCAAAGVPFFFKQWGEFKDGSDFAADAVAVLADGRVVEPTQEAMKKADREARVWGATMMRRVGKKAAGRLLDDVEHNGMPGNA